MLEMLFLFRVKVLNYVYIRFCIWKIRWWVYFCDQTHRIKSNFPMLKWKTPKILKYVTKWARKSIHHYYIAINVKWLKLSDKGRGTSVPIPLDIGTLTWYWHAYSGAFACCRRNVHDVARKTVIRLCRIWLLHYKNSCFKVTNCKWHNIFIAI